MNIPSVYVSYFLIQMCRKVEENWSELLQKLKESVQQSAWRLAPDELHVHSWHVSPEKEILERRGNLIYVIRGFKGCHCKFNSESLI